MSYKKNTQVEVLPVVDLCKETAEKRFFLWVVQCNTGGVRIQRAKICERQPQNLERGKIRGHFHPRPRQILSHRYVSSYIHTVSSRCLAACGRSDGRGQSCVRGLCCPVVYYIVIILVVAPIDLDVLCLL